jgi:hypothetical protein
MHCCCEKIEGYVVATAITAVAVLCNGQRAPTSAA